MGKWDGRKVDCLKSFCHYKERSITVTTTTRYSPQDIFPMMPYTNQVNRQHTEPDVQSFILAPHGNLERRRETERSSVWRLLCLGFAIIVIRHGGVVMQ